MQKVRGHLHSDSTPSWPTDHVARKGREYIPRIECMIDMRPRGGRPARGLLRLLKALHFGGGPY